MSYRIEDIADNADVQTFLDKFKHSFGADGFLKIMVNFFSSYDPSGRVKPQRFIIYVPEGEEPELEKKSYEKRWYGMYFCDSYELRHMGFKIEPPVAQ